MLKDKVDVPIELEDAEFMRLALEAHEKDITLNQHVNDLSLIHISEPTRPY